MKKILVMGGNQFVGKEVAKKLLEKNYKVYVLNRGIRKNLDNAIFLKADRKNISEMKNILKNIEIDVIIDISAYTEEQVEILQRVMKNKFKQYILISSASIFSRIKYNLPIYIPNKGNNIVQFGYIEDLASAIELAVENSDFYGQVFNISGDEYVAITEFAEICGKIMNKKSIIKHIDTEEKNIKARDWFPFREVNLFGDISKLENTGFRNKYSLIKGLEKTYKYNEEHDLIIEPNLNEIEKEN